MEGIFNTKYQSGCFIKSFFGIIFDDLQKDMKLIQKYAQQYTFSFIPTFVCLIRRFTTHKAQTRF